MLALAGALVPAMGWSAELFSDNFESGLAAWTGKDGGSHSGFVISDPLNPGNHVLSFSSTAVGGDVFSVEGFAVDPSSVYTVEFDYLGYRPEAAGKYSGGYLGLDSGYNVRPEHWIFGEGAWVQDLHAIEDGAWHHYMWAFRGDAYGISTLHLKMEDFATCGPIVGDALFDNVRLTTVPESMSLVALSMGLLLALRRNSRQA